MPCAACNCKRCLSKWDMVAARALAMHAMDVQMAPRAAPLDGVTMYAQEYGPPAAQPPGTQHTGAMPPRPDASSVTTTVATHFTDATTYTDDYGAQPHVGVPSSDTQTCNHAQHGPRSPARCKRLQCMDADRKLQGTSTYADEFTAKSAVAGCAASPEDKIKSSRMTALFSAQTTYLDGFGQGWIEEASAMPHVTDVSGEPPGAAPNLAVGSCQAVFEGAKHSRELRSIAPGEVPSGDLPTAQASVTRCAAVLASCARGASCALVAQHRWNVCSCHIGHVVPRVCM